MANGLHPSSNGIRITYLIPGEKSVVTEVPFAESNEVVAGFILIEVNFREEEIRWAIKTLDP